YLYSNDTHVKVGTFRNRSFNSNSINSVFYFTNVGVFISIALELYRLYSKSYIVHRLTTTDVASLYLHHSPLTSTVVINFHIQIVHILARLPHNSAILEMMTCICK
ncbi:hypothetical protein BLOT_014264, partial [Blomia tropicalis]